MSVCAARHDLTTTFRELVEARSPSSCPLPPTPHGPSSSRADAAQSWQTRRRGEAQWNEEAAQLVKAAAQLHALVSSASEAYLDLTGHCRYDGSVPPLDFARHDVDHGGPAEHQQPHQTSEQPSRFTDAQRDELDLHLKLVLDKSIAKLKQLITAEEKRRASEHHTQSSSTLARFFTPAPSPNVLDSPAYSAQLGEHRNAITAIIGASLKRAGERMGRMQQARARALETRMGKTRILSRRNTMPPAPKSGSTFSFTAAGTGSPGEDELTQEQVQLFASESSALTKTLQAELAAVENATSTLHAIAELQTTLLQHLSIQNDAITSLADEAIDQHGEVQRGNTLLNQAKERSRSANRLLSAFLVGSGLGLLFLHVVD